MFVELFRQQTHQVQTRHIHITYGEHTKHTKLNLDMSLIVIEKKIMFGCWLNVGLYAPVKLLMNIERNIDGKYGKARKRETIEFIKFL